MKKITRIAVALCLLLLVFTVCGCTPDIEYSDAAVISIAVDGISKVEYTAGDGLEIDGAKVHAIYDDGTVEVVDLTADMIDKTSFDMTQPGVKNIKVTYGGASTTFTVTVYQWDFNSVVLYSEPYVTEYVEGQSIDLTGATVRINFNAGRYSDVPVSRDMLQDYDPYKLGEQTVYLTYFGVTMHFTVKYIAKTPTAIAVIDSAAENYVYVGFGERYDLTGMTVRISYDNEQTPLVQAADIEEDLTLAIDDSVSGATEAVMMYLPEDYPEEFVYYYYGTAFFKAGERVKPNDELASNHIKRNNTEITLASVYSKSYGVITSVSTNSVTGLSTMVISPYISYNLTNVQVSKGQILANGAGLGRYGSSAVSCYGGGIVTAVENGVVTVRTAPTVTFTTTVKTRNYASMEIVDVDTIRPKKYADITTLQNMIQGDEIDFATGFVRVYFDDQTSEVYSFDSTFINVVNSGVKSVNEGLDISKAGRYELWIVYGGVVEHRTSLYIVVESRYPVALKIVSETNTVVGSRFYFGDTISVASIRYYVEFNNGSVSDEEQLTADMLAEGYSLDCVEDPNGAYVKYVAFTLPEKYASMVPKTEDGETIINSEVFSCRVLPQPILGMDVLTAPSKVYVSSFDALDLTGTELDVYYRDNSSKRLNGADLQKAEGELDVGGKVTVKSGDDDEYESVYINEDTFKIYIYGKTVSNLVDLTGYRKDDALPVGAYYVYNSTLRAFQLQDKYSPDKEYYAFYSAATVTGYRDGDALPVGKYYLLNKTTNRFDLQTTYASEAKCDTSVYEYGYHMLNTYLGDKTEIGKRRTATLIYTDTYYDNYNKDITSEKPTYYEEGDCYSATMSFYYYTITNSAWAVDTIKVELTSAGGVKSYKDAYAQYEEWDMTGVRITLTLQDKTTRIIDATGDMVYDSSTNRIGTDIPVKFSFLGATDDASLKISVSDRTETGIDLIYKGKDTYMAGMSMDFSDYTFYMQYNAGPYEVIKNLKVTSMKKTYGWWYTLYKKVYVVRNVNGLIVDKDGNPTTRDSASYLTAEAAQAAADLANKKNPEWECTVEVTQGTSVNSMSSQIGDLWVELHHTVAATDTAEETDVSVLFLVTVVENKYEIEAVEYIGSSGYYLDEEEKVYSSYYAGFGSGKDYVIRDEFSRIVVLDSAGNFVGLMDNDYNIDTQNTQEKVYYAASAMTKLTEDVENLNTYTVSENADAGTYCVKNGNGTVVDAGGAVGNAVYYETSYGATAAKALFDNRTTKVYSEKFDDTLGMYYIRNNKGRTVTSLGYEVNLYYTESETAVSLSKKNAFVIAPSGTQYVLTYDTATATALGKENLSWSTLTFSSLTAAREYAKENGLEYYYIENNIYVLAEVAAGWDIMMSEYVDGAVTEKMLSVYYVETDEVGKVPISAEMLSYSKLETSTGYRKIKINYQNASTDVLIHVWQAELVAVDILVMPTTNYIRYSDLDVSKGVLQLKFKKYDEETGDVVGYMYKYVGMDNSDVHCEGFNSTVFSKKGVAVTVTVTYRDYTDLSTSFTVKIYDLQDVTFRFDDTIFFYGSADNSSYRTVKLIEEFTLPDASSIAMFYIEQKDLIPNKQYEAMTMPDSERKLYYPVIVYDELGELSQLYYINIANRMSAHPYDPVSGTYYAIYSAYAVKDSDGYVTERYTLSEYNALSEEQKAACVPVEGDGDILYSYSETDYAKLPYATQRECVEVDNKYYLLMTVEGNTYYQSGSYALQEYGIIPTILKIEVVSAREKSLVLRVETKDNAAAVLETQNPEKINEVKKQMRETFADYESYISNFSLISPNTDYFEFLIDLDGSVDAVTVADLTAVNIADLEDAVTQGTASKKEKAIYYALETYYKALSLMAISSDITGITFGEEGTVFNTNNTKKGEMMTDFCSAIACGVNCFNVLKNDTDYHISYKVEYGATYKRNDKLQLVSGKLHFSYSSLTNKFTVIAGTLGHSSYSVDLKNAFTFTIAEKKAMQITVFDYDEDDYLFRVYMNNAEAVYSKCATQGSFEGWEESATALDYIEAFSVVSPNTEYFELRFTPAASWTGSDEQKQGVYDVCASVLSDLVSSGATEVYFGKNYATDTTFLGNDANASKVNLPLGDAVYQEASFVGRSKDLSGFYTQFLDAIAAYTVVPSKVMLDIPTSGTYLLRIGVNNYWTGKQKEDLGGAVYDFLQTMMTALGLSEIVFDGTAFTPSTDKDNFVKTVFMPNVQFTNNIYSVPIEVSGSLYGFFDEGEYTDIVATLKTANNYLDAIDVWTENNIQRAVFEFDKDRNPTVSTYTGSSADQTELRNVFFRWLRNLTAWGATKVYYGDSSYYYSSESDKTNLTAQLQNSLQEGVNVFANRDGIYYNIISYRVDTVLLTFDETYVLPNGRIVEDMSVYNAITGEYGIASEPEGTNNLYSIELSQYDTVKIKIK